MFVTVRYGDDRTKIFNAFCKNEILLENIKLQCGCGTKDVVEVSDERGVVKNLRNFPSEYGSEFLKEREILVLLTVRNALRCGGDENETDNTRPFFTPSLHSLRNDQAFNDTLNHEPHLPESPDSTTGNGRTSSRRQQLPSDSEADDVVGKGFKNKIKALGTMNGSSAGSKKAIFRKSTKNLLRK